MFSRNKLSADEIQKTGGLSSNAGASGVDGSASVGKSGELLKNARDPLRKATNGGESVPDVYWARVPGKGGSLWLSFLSVHEVMQYSLAKGTQLYLQLFPFRAAAAKTNSTPNSAPSMSPLSNRPSQSGFALAQCPFRKRKALKSFRRTPWPSHRPNASYPHSLEFCSLWLRLLGPMCDKRYLPGICVEHALFLARHGTFGPAWRVCMVAKWPGKIGLRIEIVLLRDTPAHQGRLGRTKADRWFQSLAFDRNMLEVLRNQRRNVQHVLPRFFVESWLPHIETYNGTHHGAIEGEPCPTQSSIWIPGFRCRLLRLTSSMPLTLAPPEASWGICFGSASCA